MIRPILPETNKFNINKHAHKSQTLYYLGIKNQDVFTFININRRLNYLIYLENNLDDILPKKSHLFSRYIKKC